MKRLLTSLVRRSSSGLLLTAVLASGPLPPALAQVDKPPAAFEPSSKLVEAEAELSTGYRGLAAALGLEDAYSQEAANLLVALYEARGRPQEADPWRAKRPAPRSAIP